MRNLTTRLQLGARTAARLVVSAEARERALHEAMRFVSGKPALPARVERVLVVCHGNICRSPFAEAALRSRLPGVAVHSAGLAAATGDPADPVAVSVARDFGIDLRGHRARALEDRDCEWADLLFTMEARQASAIARGREDVRGKVRVLGDYRQRPPFTIEDPWGQGEAAFRRAFGRILEAVDAVAPSWRGVS
jgi:protein-tyrosine phosphatase